MAIFLGKSRPSARSTGLSGAAGLAMADEFTPLMPAQSDASPHIVAEQEMHAVPEAAFEPGADPGLVTQGDVINPEVDADVA